MKIFNRQFIPIYTIITLILLTIAGYLVYQRFFIPQESSTNIPYDLITQEYCEQDSDCTIVHQDFKYTCCEVGTCRDIDYSLDEWIAVNDTWQKQQKENFCPPLELCEEVKECTAKIINNNYKAVCVENVCQKTNR